MPVSTAVVGRQPIVDRHRETIGYELLFRALETSTSAFEPLDDEVPDEIRDQAVDGDAMSTNVILNTMGIGVSRVIGDKLAFCNADRGVLSGRVEIALPPQRTVIEVLETVDVDEEILAGCRYLRKAGYRLAADDFQWFDGAERLLELVHMVKIDVRLTPLDDLPALMDRCRPFGVQFLAEKVETDEEFDRCLDLGFELFQGYLLGRPNTIASPALGPSRQGVLRLAGALLSADTEFHQLEGIVRGEPALTYQLLQLAAIGRLGETKRDVRSIREALVSVGLTRIRGWLPALLLRPAGPATDTALPTVLSRARLAELIALRVSPHQSGFAFAAGMLSAFDLLMGIPRDELVHVLEVPDDLREAAFAQAGGMGRVVGAAIAYQEDGSMPIDLPGVARADLDVDAARAFSWAMRMTTLLDQPASRRPAPPADPRRSRSRAVRR